MAWTSGFFNSNNGDRLYTAEQLSKIFEGLITDGVYESVTNKLAVQPNNGMVIQINTGRGWFGGHWVKNDSEYLLTLEDSDVTLNRYCAVCIRVDEGNAVRDAVPYLKYSEFATNPVKPNMERTELVKEYCLAYVMIKAGASAISASDIEDTRANSNLCGWVTGLIKQVNATTLWEQWESLFGDFMDAKEADFLEWYNKLIGYMDENIEAKLTADVLYLKNQCIRSSGTFDGLGWNSQNDGTYTQTITVMGVTPDNDIVVAPENEYYRAYKEMGIEAIAQGENTVTFSCPDPQDVNVVVGVIIYNFSPI